MNQKQYDQLLDIAHSLEKEGLNKSYVQTDNWTIKFERKTDSEFGTS